MEFHVWGKLDENGKIQSVQSSCSHGNGLNFLPDPVPGETWVGESGEKYVPYSTRKELVYKLDTKIDEMSVIMVQMGELTKRLNLQEKLIAEYEEKSERHQSEMKKLRRENDELRSLVFKRKRNSSSSFGSFDDTSATSPKTPAEGPCSSDPEHSMAESAMECSGSDDQVHVNPPVPQKGAYSYTDSNNARVVLDEVDGVGGMKRLSASDNSANICDTQTKAHVQTTGVPLEVDANGYVPLWGGSDVKARQASLKRTLPVIDQKGYAHIPENEDEDEDQEKPVEITDSGLDEMDGFSNMANVSVAFSVSETTWHNVRERAGQPEAGGATPSCHVTTTESKHAAESAPAVKEDTNMPSPDVHKHQAKPPRYCEIPDGLVSPSTPPPASPPKGQGHYQDHVHSLCQGRPHSPDSDRYSTRPPMPLPGRRCSHEGAPTGSPSRSLEPPSAPYRAISKEAKNSTNDEKRDTEAYIQTQRMVHHRHSSPEIADLGADERLTTLITNMRTTMEWNKARKLLISKSTTCTTEQAEESLRSVVKETYYKCSTKLGGSAKIGVENLAQRFRTYLRKKDYYDDDILTKEFLQKCLHLLRTS